MSFLSPPTGPLRRGTVLLSLTSNLAWAQQGQYSSGDFAYDLGETVVVADQITENENDALANQVSAYRTGTALKDVPQSVTVVTAEELQRQGLDSIGDIVDYTPGVNTSQGEGHRDAIVFRGIRSTADFFVDGVRDDVQYYRSLYNVEQVEVLKGPNSLTFGRGGTGGVLNRVFKKAEVGQDFFEYQTSVDTFGAYSGQFDYNQSLGDQWAFRLNVHYDQLDNHRDLYDGERFGINPTFTYQLSDATQLRFAYEYANHDRFIDRGIPSTPAGRVATQFDGVTFGDSELNFNDLESHTVRLSLDHDFSDTWKGRLNAFYGTYDKVYANYFSSDFDGANRVELDGYIDRTDRQRFSIAGDLVGEFSTASLDHKLLVGAEYIHTTSRQNRLNNVWDSNGDDQQFFDVSGGLRLTNGVVRNNAGAVLDRGTFSDLNDDTDVTLNVYSFFIQDEIAVHEKVDLILGARFDSFDIEVDDLRNGGTLTRTDEEITPRLGLVFKPSSNLSFYGTYSESFLPRSGEQFADLGGGDDSLDPDTAANLEAGLKWDLQEDLSLTLAAFQIQRTSTEVDDDNADALVEIDSEINGFEAQLKGQLTDQWFLSAGYTYLDGEQVGQDGDTGLRLRELPEHAFSIWNSYQVNEKLNLGLGCIYQGDSFADNGNNVTLPSYVRFDASARYDFSEDFAVQLNVENLFDTDYYPNAHNPDNITVGAPLSARLSFIGRF